MEMDGQEVVEIEGGNFIHGTVFKDGGYQSVSAHVPCGFSVNVYEGDYISNYKIEVLYNKQRVGNQYSIGDKLIEEQEKKLLMGLVASDFKSGLLEKLANKMDSGN